MRRHGSARRRNGGDQFAEVSRERLEARVEEEPEIAEDAVEEEPISPADDVMQEAGESNPEA